MSRDEILGQKHTKTVDGTLIICVKTERTFMTIVPVEKLDKFRLHLALAPVVA